VKVDLHTHSTYSDGTLEPDELITSASKTGITHMALCDHDSTSGLKSANEKAKEYGMTIIPAIEINTRDTIAIHILGYFIDEKSEDLQKTLIHHRTVRTARAQMILDKLHRMGIKIHISDFSNGKDGSAIGRPHIADKLKEMGLVFSRQEAFDKYLGQGRSAFIAYEDGPTPKDAIDAISGSGGVPVLAHPGYFVSPETIESLTKIGLQGIEVYYPSHREEQIRNFVVLAKKLDIIPTGGSDYHGPGSGHERLGEIPVPEKTVDLLLERKQKLYG